MQGAGIPEGLRRGCDTARAEPQRRVDLLVLAYTHIEKLDAKHTMHDPLPVEPVPDEPCEADRRCCAGKSARRARDGLDSCSTWH